MYIYSVHARCRFYRTSPYLSVVQPNIDKEFKISFNTHFGVGAVKKTILLLQLVLFPQDVYFVG